MQQSRETELDPSLLPENNGFDLLPTFLGMLAILAVVVALIIGLSWVLKRIGGPSMQGGTAKGICKLQGTYHLGDKRFLALVQVADRHLLLGITNESIRVLKELDPAELEPFETGQPTRPGASFGSLLNRFMGREGGGGRNES